MAGITFKSSGTLEVVIRGGMSTLEDAPAFEERETSSQSVPLPPPRGAAAAPGGAPGTAPYTSLYEALTAKREGAEAAAKEKEAARFRPVGLTAEDADFLDDEAREVDAVGE